MWNLGGMFVGTASNPDNTIEHPGLKLAQTLNNGDFTIASSTSIET